MQFFLEVEMRSTNQRCKITGGASDEEEEEGQWRIFPESLTLKNADTFVADNAARRRRSNVLGQTSLAATTF